MRRELPGSLSPAVLVGNLTLASLVAFGAMGCKKDEEVPAVPIEAVTPMAPDASSAPGSSDNSVAPSPVGPSRETEPNDSRDGASRLPLNGVAVGAIQFRAAQAPAEGDARSPAPVAPDEDWYVLILETPGAQQIRLQLTPEDRADVVLEWMTDAPPPPEPVRGKGRRKPRPPADVLASIDNTEGGGIEIFPPTPLAPGKHYFRVKTKPAKLPRKGVAAPEPARDRPYRLSTTVVDTEPALEQEPNADTATSGVLRPGEARQGFVGWARDIDWYRLDVSSAAPGAFIKIQLTGVQDTKLRLWLVDKNKATLTKIPEGKAAREAGQPVTIRDFTVSPESQPYYVAVDSLKGASPSERYTLTLDLDPPADGRETEPNWRATVANALSDKAPVEGWVAHPSDWDVYRLDSNEPIVLAVTASGVPDVDLQLELIRDNKVLATVSENGVGEPETLPLVPVGPTPGYVRVSSKGGTWNAHKSYTISSIMTAVGSGELEPNNDFGDVQGSTLAVGQSLEGHIHPRADIDIFSFEVRGEAGSSRPLRIELAGLPGMTMSVQIHDVKKVAQKKVGAITDASTPIDHAFPPGRYFLRVREETGQLSDADHSYTLRLLDPVAEADPVAPPGAVPTETPPSVEGAPSEPAPSEEDRAPGPPP